MQAEAKQPSAAPAAPTGRDAARERRWRAAQEAADAAHLAAAVRASLIAADVDARRRSEPKQLPPADEAMVSKTAAVSGTNNNAAAKDSNSHSGSSVDSAAIAAGVPPAPPAVKVEVGREPVVKGEAAPAAPETPQTAEFAAAAPSPANTSSVADGAEEGEDGPSSGLAQDAAIGAACAEERLFVQEPGATELQREATTPEVQQQCVAVAAGGGN